MNWFQKMLDPKERSIEIHHVAGLGTLAAHWLLAVWQVLHDKVVDLMSFGTGAAAIIGAVGTAGWLTGKQRAVDPACKDDPK